MSITQGTCQICGAPASLSLSAGNDKALCGAIECKKLWQKRNTTPSMLFKSQVEHRRRVVRKQEAEAEATRQYHRDVAANEAQEGLEILKLVDMELPASSANPRIMNVPSGSTEMVPLSKERIALYTESLQSALDNAFKLLPLPEDDEIEHESIDPDGLNSVLKHNCDQLCAFCKGGCCGAGGNHAFITEKTILRILSVNPSFSKTELLEYYLSRIQDMSSEGACINQTDKGCLLPREMRSDTCNTYFCDEILNYQKTFDEETEENDSLLVVKRAYSNWNRLNRDADRRVVNVGVVSSQGTQEIDLAKDS